MPLDQYYYHRSRMKQIVQELKAKVIVEAGTNVGRSTRIWAEALEETDGHLWTVDVLPPMDNWHRDYPLNHRITYLQEDILHLSWKDDRPIDLLYIDDDHTYPHVLYELRRWGPWVRIGGRILLDDVQHGDLVYMEPNTAWQIIRSIHEFCRENILPWIIHPWNQGMAEIVVTHPIRKVVGASHEHRHAQDTLPVA